MPSTKRKNVHHYLADVPPQELILKNQVGSYSDNTRKHPVGQGASKYMGVYFDKNQKSWRAQIMFEGRNMNLGNFQSEIAAAEVYAKAAFKFKQRTKPQTYGGLDLSNVPSQSIQVSNAAKGTYRGVKPCRGKWQARMSMAGRLVHLGTFDTPEEAAQIFAKAEYACSQKRNEKRNSAAAPKKEDASSSEEEGEESSEEHPPTTSLPSKDKQKPFEYSRLKKRLKTLWTPISSEMENDVNNLNSSGKEESVQECETVAASIVEEQFHNEDYTSLLSTQVNVHEIEYFEI